MPNGPCCQRVAQTYVPGLISTKSDGTAVYGQIDGCGAKINPVAQSQSRITTDVNRCGRIADNDTSPCHGSAESIRAIHRCCYAAVPNRIVNPCRCHPTNPTGTSLEIAGIVGFDLVGMCKWSKKRNYKDWQKPDTSPPARHFTPPVFRRKLSFHFL